MAYSTTAEATKVTIRDLVTGEEFTTRATVEITTFAFGPAQVVIEGDFRSITGRAPRPSERAALEAAHRESAIRDRLEDDVDAVALRPLFAAHPLALADHEPHCPRCSTPGHRESWPCGRVRALETYLLTTGAGQ